jgi:hypothetical protein
MRSPKTIRPARALLERQRPKPGKTDLRGFEWRHLWQLWGDEFALFPMKAHGRRRFHPTADGSPAGSAIVVRDVESWDVVTTSPRPAETLSFHRLPISWPAAAVPA